MRRRLRRGAPAAAREHRVTWQAASVLLGYPDADLVARLPLVAAAVAPLPAALREPLAALTDDLAGHAGREGGLMAAQQRYVETFDHKRRRTMLLTYWTAGDTRNRGMAMLRFAETYRASGATPPAGELPDHLPVVLEFAATVDYAAGHDLLASHAVPIGLLRDALEQSGSPYAGVVSAVAATLPAPGPDGLREARRLALAGPPVEAVGLDLAPFPTTRPDPLSSGAVR